MKLNWFSPVPPTPSSIALDTAAILPALAQRAKVTVWVHEQEWSPELEARAEVRRYDLEAMPWREINAADISVYHLGNHNAFHGPIWQVHRQSPGIVVLHDLNMQHFFNGLLLDTGAITRSDYLRLMTAHHGEEGRELAKAFLSGAKSVDEVAQTCSLMGATIENALGVAVHTEAGRAQLAQLTDQPVRHVPLFAAPIIVSDSAKSKGPCRLILFGFLGANRRLESILRALHELPERDRFHLDVYGQIAKEKPFRRLISELGLSRFVSVHGYAEAKELDAALQRSDLALNLRDPTMGEASASQLRIWQHGLPSLVTDVGWYSKLPVGTVGKVRRDFELADLQMHLAEILRAPERYRAMGEAGRAYVNAHHTIEVYLDALWELIEATLAAAPRQTASAMADRAGRLMRPWYTDEAASVCLPRLAESIHDLFGIH